MGLFGAKLETLVLVYPLSARFREEKLKDCSVEDAAWLIMGLADLVVGSVVFDTGVDRAEVTLGSDPLSVVFT